MTIPNKYELIFKIKNDLLSNINLISNNDLEIKVLKFIDKLIEEELLKLSLPEIQNVEVNSKKKRIIKKKIISWVPLIIEHFKKTDNTPLKAFSIASLPEVREAYKATSAGGGGVASCEALLLKILRENEDFERAPGFENCKRGIKWRLKNFQSETPGKNSQIVGTSKKLSSCAEQYLRSGREVPFVHYYKEEILNIIEKFFKSHSNKPAAISALLLSLSQDSLFKEKCSLEDFQKNSRIIAQFLTHESERFIRRDLPNSFSTGRPKMLSLWSLKNF